LNNIEEELVKSAANGDINRCEQLLKTSTANVNAIFAGHTALQAGKS
jgi:hypothetical protein